MGFVLREEIRYLVIVLKKCFVKKKKFQIACNGDSGSPTIWEDKDDNKRAYLMGIINGAPFR